jgi:hypothetical protein
MKLFIASCALLCIILTVVNSCSLSETTYVNHTADIINVESTTVTIHHQVGGSVKIVTGCTFFIRNLTIIPSGSGVYWWGIPDQNNTDLYARVVPYPLGSYDGQDIYFSIDPQYSFDNISIMELRSEGDDRAYAAWSITGDVNSYYGVDSNSSPPLDFNTNNGNKNINWNILTLILILIIVTLSLVTLM